MSKNIEKQSGHKSTLREGSNCYFYEFSPPLDPEQTNVSRKIANIIQKELFPRGGGLQLLENTTKPVAVLKIQQSTPLDVVERLFAAMRETRFDINITIEQYPKKET